MKNPFEGECTAHLENVKLQDGRQYSRVYCLEKQGHKGEHKNQDIVWPQAKQIKHSPRYNLNKLRQEIALLERLVQ